MESLSSVDIPLYSLEDNTHRTIFHYAIIKENYDLVEYLITLSNVNVCVKDKQGEYVIF